MAISERVRARVRARQGDVDMSFEKVQGHACMLCNPGFAFGSVLTETVIRVRTTIPDGIPNTRYICPGCIDELSLACAR